MKFSSAQTCILTYLLNYPTSTDEVLNFERYEVTFRLTILKFSAIYIGFCAWKFSNDVEHLMVILEHSRTFKKCFAPAFSAPFSTHPDCELPKLLLNGNNNIARFSMKKLLFFVQ